MAEGQDNGHDSPERDSAWQPSPPPGGDPGTPEPDTEPGAADPGASWLPFRMTSPAEESAQAAQAEPVPGAPPARRTAGLLAAPPGSAPHRRLLAHRRSPAHRRLPVPARRRSRWAN